MAQYVYTMNRVGKIVPPKRQILKDISLSFFPGAKIGVLGLNGAGKSTLLKIMAGVDKDIEGDGFVFGRAPEVGFSGWSKIKTNIDSGITKMNGKPIVPWRLHDFRHTISTHLNEQPDANPDLIDRLLAHKRKGTERLYNHAQLIDAKRELLLKWEALLRSKGVIIDV